MSGITKNCGASMGLSAYLRYGTPQSCFKSRNSELTQLVLTAVYLELIDEDVTDLSKALARTTIQSSQSYEMVLQS